MKIPPWVSDIAQMILIIVLAVSLMYVTMNCDKLVQSRDAEWSRIIQECKCSCSNLYQNDFKNISYPTIELNISNIRPG